MTTETSTEGTGESPVPPALRRSGATSLAAEVRDALSRRHRELPPRFLADRAIATTRRSVEQIVDERFQRIERPLVRAWVDAVASSRTFRRLVDVAPSGTTTALVLLETLAERMGLRQCVVVEDTTELAQEGAARCAAARADVTALPVVANPTMTIPVERSANTCFTLFGAALMRYTPVTAVRVLRAVRTAMSANDVLLVGLDLRSTDARQADRTMHTELMTAWHRHALTVANRELSMEFPVETFHYECRYDATQKRLEEGVTCAVRTRVASPIMETLTLRAGEQLRTGVQHSYDRAMLVSMMRGVGLALHSWREADDGSHALAVVVVHMPGDDEP